MDTDKQLNDIVKLCKNGSQQGFSDLVNLYSKRIYNYFLRLSNSCHISEDLTSQVFCKVLQNIKKFKNDNFDAWIFRIASNCFTDYLREKQKHQKYLDKQAPLLSECENQILQAQVNENRALIQVELDKLDQETRDLIVLRFYSDLGFKEIAEIKKMPIGTVLSKIHRAIKQMKLSLGDKL